ncbi:MAG: fumarate reductase subunit [Frankiales bacterium]|nr:fumarate reductase subunit [Frankiales bacterium]
MTTDVRMYRRPVPVWWWTRKRTYFVFVMRELSSLFVAWFVVYLLVLLRAISQSDTAYQHFLDGADAPWIVVVNVVALAFLTLHTVTWFLLTPKAVVLRLRSRVVPAWLIIVSQYVGLVAFSALVFWLVAR